MRRYNVELSDRFKREFRKLDKYTQKIIRAWIDKNLVNCENPRKVSEIIALFVQ